LQIPLKEGIGGERDGDFTNTFHGYVYLLWMTTVPMTHAQHQLVPRGPVEKESKENC
jgi:hypothetical protein